MSCPVQGRVGSWRSGAEPADARPETEANQLVRQRYIGRVGRQFAWPAEQRGTAFRRCERKDLDAVFSIQTVWRHSLAGQTVTVHDHLNGTLAIHYGRHGREPPWFWVLL